MWFTDDIVIDDINLYEVTLMFMIMLIENDVIEDDFDNNWIRDDVVVYDNIDMRWCCYWWLCWYEMMLLSMIMLIWEDVVIFEMLL